MKSKHFKNASALLLSFLIMTALLVSVLYIARIAQRQIMTSRGTDNANIAFYAAESGNEQAIYYIRKMNTLSSDLNIETPEPLGQSGASIMRTVTEEVFDINIGLAKDDFFQFDLYDANNLGQPSYLSYLEISWDDNCDSSSWIELTANEWLVSGGVNWGHQEQDLGHIQKSLLSQTSSPNNITSIGGSTFHHDKAYQFRVKALFCDVYNLTISAYGDSESSGEDAQLPFKNTYNIKTVGQYPADSINANKQALSVTLRNTDPLSGLFDYAIFSEQSLIKNY